MKPNPEILIKADNQDTPKIDKLCHEVFKDGAIWMRDKMLKAGFVKIMATGLRTLTGKGNWKEGNMKRLYEVEAKWYVMAEDEGAAQRVIPELGSCSVFAIEATSIDADWTGAIPFEADDDRTCLEILKARET